MAKWINRNWLLLIIIMLPLGMYSLSKWHDTQSKSLQIAAIICGVLAFLFLVVVQYRREYSNGNTEVGKAQDVADRNRTFLTIWLVTMGLVLIAVFGFLVTTEGVGEEADDAKWVFSAAVPLIASWIGTVLAFYFGRENFEAATKYMLRLNRDTLDNIDVGNMMISRPTMVYISVDEGNKWVKFKDGTWKAEDDQQLSAIINLFKDINKDRVPILTGEKEAKPKYIVHLSSLMETDKEKTLADFLSENEEFFGHKKEKGFVTVSTNTSLEEATEIRSEKANIRDIFVTADGTNEGTVLGWVPDTFAQRFLNVKEK